MTHDDHQRERMRHWSQVHSHAYDRVGQDEIADNSLAEFDKRFPAPSAAAPVEPVASSVFAYDVKVIDVETYAADMAELETLRRTQAMHDAELASLRQKARLWDAVKDGKVLIHRTESGAWFAEFGSPDNPEVTGFFPTAEEAVEAAIAAGALK